VRGDRAAERRASTCASVELLDRQVHCGGKVPRYNFDHFQGALDGNQWDAVNDDGVDDVGQPYRFHRVSCEP
jgi:hypothetical protein